VIDGPSYHGRPTHVCFCMAALHQRHGRSRQALMPLKTMPIGAIWAEWDSSVPVGSKRSIHASTTSIHNLGNALCSLIQVLELRSI
jgi:hypothetical protein